MFVTRLNFTANLEQVQRDLDEILTKTSWAHEQQIGLTYRPGATDLWKDSTGSLYDRENNIELHKEEEFSEFNSSTPVYLSSLLNEFCNFQGIKIGRARFMRLLPKTGLTVHADTTERYHLVIYTNPVAYIANTLKNAGTVAAVCYHMPADSNFYKVDTTREHFVYNGGKTERVHLVISPKI